MTPSATGNAEVVAEVFRRFDPSDLGPWAETWSLDAVSTSAEGWPEQGPFVGRAAIIEQFERLFADWEDQRIEGVEITEESDEWVFAAYTLWARGAGSGLEAEFDLVVAMRVESGQIAEGHFRWNREQALEAAGLSDSS